MKRGNTVIRTIQGDITRISTVDAIVNTANSALNGGGGVDAAIHKAAGKELLAECKTLNGCRTGEAKITRAYRLPCKYIIHTCGPVWRGGTSDEERLLSYCYKNSLQIALDYGIRKIAFPSISTGVYSFPLKSAASIAIRSIFDFIDNHYNAIDEVVFVLYDFKTKFAYDEAIELLKNVTRFSQEPKIGDLKKSWDNAEALRKRAEDDRKKRLKAEKEEKERLKRVYERAVSHKLTRSSSLPESSNGKAQDNTDAVYHTSSRYSANDSIKGRKQESEKTSIRKTDNIHNKTNCRQKTNSDACTANITAHDFVVRSSVLKCRNKNHQLQDLKATVMTINKRGEVSSITVPVGYCPDCKLFFIMENVYQRIRHSAIPVCRTMDEKYYITDYRQNGIYRETQYDNLAQESVLKQFGYSVNQADDIPPIQRKNILAAIVDYGILTKSEIVSYLEYFIRSRRTQKRRDDSLKYRTAIDKWREDIDWINSYRIGTFKEVVIKRILTNR